MTLVISRPSQFIQWLSTLLLVMTITGWFLIHPPVAQAAGTVTHCTDDNTVGSLRTALAGGGTVTFDVDCTPLNLALTAVVGTHIQITANTEINANGHTVELRGNGSNRIFQLERGDNLTLIGLRITNGSTTGNGGAIEVISGANDGQITIQDSEFVNNSADVSGGAIYMPYSTNNPDVTIERSAFINNSSSAGANNGGGALFIRGPSLTVQINNSTFTGNSSATEGAVIYTRDGTTFNFYNSTIVGNTGAVAFDMLGTGGNFVFINTIVANNAGNCDAGGLAAFTDSGGSISDAAGCNITDTSFVAGTHLGALGYYGGRTRLFPLRASVANPAIDGGDCTIAPGNNQDQHGKTRLATCDIGAYEFINPTLTINNATVTEGSDPNAVFTVTLSHPIADNVTATYSTTMATAAHDVDYTGVNNTLTINAATTQTTVSIPITNDGIDENAETFNVVLSNPSTWAALGTPSTGTGTIIDDDPEPTLSISSPSASEGNGTIDFVVTLSPASGKTVTVNYGTAAGSATGGGTDYSDTSGILTFNPGETSKTINVPLNDDTLSESSETLSVNLTGPSNATIATATGTGTINDNEASPSVSISDVSLAEGDTGETDFVFDVLLNVALGNSLTLNYSTVPGTADITTPDFTSDSGTVTIPAGDTKATITVKVKGDILTEADETFFVEISNPTLPIVSISDNQATGTILNDDATPDLSIQPTSALEGNSGTNNAIFLVNLTGASPDPISVEYVTSDNTAIAGLDYITQSGTVNFPPNNTTQVISVPVLGDILDELTETFTVTLKNPVNATLPITNSAATGTINDDDEAILSVDDVMQNEGNSGPTNFVFNVRLSNPSSRVVTVTYQTQAGTAFVDTDFITQSGTVAITPGATSRPITITVLGDTEIEADEIFFVKLITATNATLPTNTQGIGTIRNDDNFTFLSIDDISVTESPTARAVFTVSLIPPRPAPVTVTYVTTDGTAWAGPTLDYLETSGELLFNPGETTKLITVTVNDDNLKEFAETFSVLLLDSSLGVDIRKETGIATIIDDDDEVPDPELSIVELVRFNEGNNGTAEMLFDVTLSKISGRPVTVTYATLPGSAQAGVDYLTTEGQLRFESGQIRQVITVPVVGDRLDEQNERFTIQLSNLQEATMVISQSTGVIIDDDNALLSVNHLTLTEGDSDITEATVNVTLSLPSDREVRVTYSFEDATAIAGQDYISTTEVLTFAPGTTVRSVIVPIIGDMIDETDEIFTITLTNPRQAALDSEQSKGTIIILNDDRAALAIDDQVFPEGNTLQEMPFAINLSLPSERLITMTYSTANGSATAARPGIAIPNPDYMESSGVVTFSPMITQQFITITILGDERFEGDETFYINLSQANAALADQQAEGVIVNDDPREGDLPTVSITDTVVIEGDNGLTNAVFTVTLLPISRRPISVTYLVIPGTATAGEDYETVASNVFTIPAGVTQQLITVPVIGDDIDESDEQFTVVLTSTTQLLGHNVATATIVDDDAATISVNDLTIREGDATQPNIVFVVSLSNPSERLVSVEYRLTGPILRSALERSTRQTVSQTPPQGVVVFQPGETEQTIIIPVEDDTIVEEVQLLLVRLSDANRATIAKSEGIATILDDDGPPTLYIEDVTVSEGEVALFTVQLWPGSDQTVTVDYATANDTAGAGDFTADSGTLSFSPQQTSQQISIRTNLDQTTEGDETFFLNLSNPTGAALDQKQSAQATLKDAPVGTGLWSIEGPSEIIEGNSGSQPVVFFVTLSPPSDQELRVDYQLNNPANTATPGEDFEPTEGGTLVFAPNQEFKTITIFVNGDVDEEADETLYLTLANPSGSTQILNRQAILRIVDDDRQPSPVYLPLLLKQPIVTPPTPTPTPTATIPAGPPDLVVSAIVATNDTVEVVIQNTGGEPITPAQAFWVELYVNPSPPPTGVNQAWLGRSNQGVSWRVTEPALPLLPGESLRLRYQPGESNPYVLDEFTEFAGNLPGGTPLYAQVDSSNASTTYGNVLEGHEQTDEPYNNITGPVLSVDPTEPTATPTTMPPTATPTATPTTPPAITAPDLVVSQVVVRQDGVDMVIANQGTAPVNTTSFGFWVDLYVDPDPPPQGVNQSWNDGRSDYGVAWGITGIVLAPGETLTLRYSTAADASNRFVDAGSRWPASLTGTTPVYVQVDSANMNTDYGSVLERHELTGGSYNNIIGPLFPINSRLTTESTADLTLELTDTIPLPPRPGQ